MEHISILYTIDQILEERTARPTNVKGVSALKNHKIFLDHNERKIYIGAEIIYDNLDNGADLTELSHNSVYMDGIVPGDVPIQVIDKKLAGPGHMFNVVPVSSMIDLAQWKNDEDIVYDHVKKQKGHAFAAFALEYDDNGKNKFCRPTKIYYHYSLYDKNKEIVENGVMEGVVGNPRPEMS